MTQSASTKSNLGIATVAKITGISQHLLRIWERRYQVVTTARSSSGRRLYSMQDVSRLGLIKRLVNAGEPISRVAVLDDETLSTQLKALEKVSASNQPDSGRKPIKVAVLGDTLSVKLDQLKETPAALDIAVNTSSIRYFRSEIVNRQPDALIIESPLINSESRQLIRTMIDESGATRIIVIYQFGRRAEIDLLRPQGVRLVRNGNRLEDIFDLLTLPVARDTKPDGLISPDLCPEQSEEVAPRRFSEQDLVRLGAVVSSIECECPNHLADLLSGLNAFEHYVKDCESRNNEDAAFHAYLYSVTAAARVSFEIALDRVVQEEGLQDLINRSD